MSIHLFIRLKPLLLTALLSLLPFAKLSASQGEEMLSLSQYLEKAVLLYKKHDKPLLIKLHYKTPQGKTWTSLFKPKRAGSFPLAPEYSYQKIVKSLGSSVLFKISPMLPFTLKKSDLERLATDNPDTSVNERDELLAALSGTAEYTATPSFVTDRDGSLALFGSNTMWVSNLKVDTRNRDGWLNSVSNLNSSNQTDKAIIQLLLVDFIAANNDRAGNLSQSQQDRSIWAIDNDDSFISASSKKFCRNMFNGITSVDKDFMNALKNLKTTLSNQESAETFFPYYSENERSRYHKQTLERINEVIDRFN